MIHGMVDRPLVFTMDQLKRLPYVSRIHRMSGESRQADAQNSPGDTRIDKLRGMDGGAAVAAAMDGGASWRNAELRSPAYPMAHTRFGFHWNWDGKECVLMSRCTDEPGTVQPTRADVAKYWNEPLDKVRIRGADNSVQAWKVGSDGSVRNGLA
jgi:hypothetical protein